MNRIDKTPDLLQPPPLFLSQEGYRKAMEIYGRYNPATGRPAADDLKEAKEVLFESEWRDFDLVYTALYTLNLANVRRLPRDTASSSSVLSPSKRVAFLLDIDLRPPNARFQLLDERCVIAVMAFKQELESVIPFKGEVDSLGFGCFYMSFRFQIAKDDKSPREKNEALLLSVVRSDRFKLLFERFHVADIEI